MIGGVDLAALGLFLAGASVVLVLIVLIGWVTARGVDELDPYDVPPVPPPNVRRLLDEIDRHNDQEAP